MTKKTLTNELVITELNIAEVESQIMILQSLVENEPNSKNIKELVELLKKVPILIPRQLSSSQ